MNAKSKYDYKGLWKAVPKGLQKMSRKELLKEVNSIRRKWENYTGISQQLDYFIIKDWTDKDLRKTIKFYSSKESKQIAKNWIEKKKKQENESIISKLKRLFK